jgi:hypothetical protein
LRIGRSEDIDAIRKSNLERPFSDTDDLWKRLLRL